MPLNQAIELHIDQLILEGFSPRDAFYIGRALERRLTYLIQQKGLPTGMNHPLTIPNIDAGQFHFNQKMKPNTIGQQIATSVYNGFNASTKTL